MNFAQIENAIGQHLAGMANCPPIAWPNKDFTPTGDYLEFRHSPNERINNDLTGGFDRQTGIVLITVISQRDKFTATALNIAQNISNRFPKGLRLTAGTGKVLISNPAALAAGFVDGSYWRQPVTIRYLTEE